MEQGVGVWVRENSTEFKWEKGRIEKIQSNGNGQQVSVRIARSNPRHKALELTLTPSEIENETHELVKLANSYDLDLVDDLVNLTHLNEPAICHTLHQRFRNKQIYTFTGDFLVAVNPFEKLNIYSDEQMELYMKQPQLQEPGAKEKEIKPHVYFIADKAYRALHDESTDTFYDAVNQSILVSGESGSGKTETTKFVMAYLAAISKENHENKTMQQVLSSNPILESFGNARTIRNDNSSRFGKFIKMQFDDDGHLSGAVIQTYLLEKVRLDHQARGERNYHIFYELLAGATEEENKKWKLGSAKSFHYVNQSKCYERKDRVNDAEQFQVLKEAMKTMGFSGDESENIFSTIATLLHIGNLNFDYHEIKAGEEGSKLKSNCEEAVEMATKYFEVDTETLEKALCFRKISANGEDFLIGLTPEDAQSSRDALSRYLYGVLFDWIVLKVNKMIRSDEEEDKFIGILDIFGFEDLSTNSFEQMCINYANESLQQHFNLSVLQQEQELYESENIEWSFINFPDNAPCIELIDGKPNGIISLLDEECIVPQGSDENFARKLYKQHDGNAYFSASNSQKAKFVFCIHHYAGRVPYDTTGFCDKNKDTLYPELQQLIEGSSREFVRGLLHLEDEDDYYESRDDSRKGSSNGKQSLGSQFRMQLKDLMGTISTTFSQYIRCLKPNDQAKSGKFNSERICHQLEAGGVLEAVRVNRAGYPVRMLHKKFIKRYRCLAEAECLREMSEYESSEEYEDSELAVILVNGLCKSYGGSAFNDTSSGQSTTLRECIQVGRTKVFFRRAAIQYIEAQLSKRYGELVISIQSLARGFIARCYYSQCQKWVVSSQAITRGFIARQRYYKLNEEQRIRKQKELEKKELLEKLEKERRQQMKERSSERPSAKSFNSNVSEDFRLTERSTDPVSDESSSDNERGSKGRANGIGRAKLRFTRDYNDDKEYERLSEIESRNIKLQNGDTRLHIAASSCNEEDIYRVLEGGADVNAVNDLLQTPLHYAVKHRNFDAMKVLLDSHVDLNAQDCNGNTPLHLAKDPHIARMLLEDNCETEIVNNEGRTPLIEAVERGDMHILKILLKFNADLLYREEKHGQTCLHLAVRRGHYNIVIELCKCSRSKELIQLCDRNDNNVLHFTVARDRRNGPRLVKYLVKHGADVNKMNSRCQTPLVVHIMTTRQTDRTITQILLENGADPKIKLTDGSSLLHVAVDRGLIEIACTLVKFGASLNEPDANGRCIIECSDKAVLRQLIASITQPPVWINDNDRKSCMLCRSSFKFGSRRHHCRHCGRICCSDCSGFTVDISQFPKDFPSKHRNAYNKTVKDPQRVCKTCYSIFKNKAVADKQKPNSFLARALGYDDVPAA